MELLTFNSIPNIDKNNKFYIFREKKTISIPPGSYEIDDIEKFLQIQLESKNITIDLKENNIRSSVPGSNAIKDPARNQRLLTEVQLSPSPRRLTDTKN